MSSNERIVFGHPRGLGPRGSHHENMGSIPIARSVWKKEQWMRVMVIYGTVRYGQLIHFTFLLWRLPIPKWLDTTEKANVRWLTQAWTRIRCSFNA